ncbi:MAG: YARHG domain-containing protein [Oscillospiraceae bacterium]|nr:YARHG domain-containing protein [Oscillospiraceae bacterium]
MTDTEIGKAFTGWETDGILGSGTFGTVCLAHTTVEGKPVYAAVKVISAPPTPEAIENAEKLGISRDLLKTYFNKIKNDLNWELTMFNTVTSPHLVKNDSIRLEDMPSAGWTGYIRTPVYTPMAVYFDKVEATGEDAARLGAEMCSALEALGEYGMVHGDIKPENVLVADNGTFLLGDFGIKRCLEKAGSSLFGLTGTEFEAPELAEEKTYTPAGDIYSLGVLMSYVANNCALTLSGRPGDVEGLDPELKAIIEKATAADPAERYQSAAEMRSDITATRLYSGRRPQRRAVAAAAAFDLVKKNGSTIRSTPAQEEAPEPMVVTKPEPKAEETEPQAQPEKKKKKHTFAKVLGLIAATAACGALVWFAVNNNPLNLPSNAGNPGSSVEDNSPDDGRGSTDPAGTQQPGNNDQQPGNNNPQQGGDNPGTNPGGDNPGTNPGGDNPGTNPGTNPGGDNPGQNPPEDKPDPKPVVYGIPTWTWNGTQGASATFYDPHGSDAKQTVTAAVTSAVTKAPGCETEGTTTYTAAVSLDGKTYTDEKTEAIAPTGHSYGGPKFHWAEDNTASAVFTCKNDSSHTQTVKADMTSQTTEAQPGVEGKTVYTAAVYFQDRNYTDTRTVVIPALPVEHTDPEPQPQEKFPGTFDPKGYVLSFSAERLIERSDLEGMDAETTRYALNEIYARHGYIFTSEKFINYFAAKEWYTPTEAHQSNVTKNFSEIESQNVKTLIAYEKEMGYK